MVLEPLTAIGLAGNIVQFVDFTGKIVAKSLKLYRSSPGEPGDNASLEQVTGELRSLTKGLTIRFTPPGNSGPDAGILSVARACRTEAEKLLSVLEKLKIKHGSRVLQSAHQALADEWKKDTIEELRTNLGRLQTQLLLHLVALTK